MNDRRLIRVEVDSGPSVGLGHLFRSNALVQSLRSEGWAVECNPQLSIPAWAESALTGLDISTALEPNGSAPDVLLVDSYRADPQRLREARDQGSLVVAIVDGDHLGYEADLYIDQNYGARPLAGTPEGAKWLVGTQYALVRAAIVSRRGHRPPAQRVRPHVVALFGGTDSANVATYAMGQMMTLPDAFSLVVVTANPEAEEVAALARQRDRRLVSTIPPTRDIEQVLAAADVIVCAAGTTTWDAMALGRVTVTTSVAPNQRAILADLHRDGLALHLGDAHAWNDSAIASLAGLLEDRAARSAMAAGGWAAVDGRGPTRVTGEILDLVAAR